MRIQKKNCIYTLFVSFIFFTIHFSIRLSYITHTKTKVESLIQANQMMLHYQGMNFDLTALGPFINFNIEEDDNFEILSLRVKTNKNLYERYFQNDSIWPLNSITINASFEETQALLNVKFTTYRALWILFFSILCTILLLSLVLFIKLVLERKRSRELEYLARQVSHDIRSPLAALNVALSDINNLDENKKALILSAYKRITDIANNLLSSYNNESKKLSEATSPTLIGNIILSIASEKRSLIKNQNIRIITDPLISNSENFVKINNIEFERVLSNLINNSIEAFDSSDGEISISLKSDLNVHISIKDNGPGISPEILHELGKTEISTKKSGSGLGLYHAIKTISKWDGELNIESIQGQGTEIVITLPSCHSPKWFKNCIHISTDTEVILLDDDETIHLLWKEKFKKTNIQLLHFYLPNELNEWLEKKYTNDFFVLSDYDFKDSKVNGIDLLTNHNLQNKSLIVSSKLHEKIVVEQLVNSNITGLPKTLAKNLEINLIERPNQKFDLVLIDDDKYVRLAWEESAKNNNLKILTLESIEAFLSSYSHLDSSLPIYIDSHLSNGEKGEIDSKKIFDLNFNNLFIATGYSSMEIIKPLWIKNVVGKNPSSVMNLRKI